MLLEGLQQDHENLVININKILKLLSSPWPTKRDDRLQSGYIIYDKAHYGLKFGNYDFYLGDKRSNAIGVGPCTSSLRSSYEASSGEDSPSYLAGINSSKVQEVEVCLLITT